MSTWDNCYIEFDINSQQRFQTLVNIFDGLKHDKLTDHERDVEDWLEFFKDREFQELEWVWDFEAIIDVIMGCEYDLISCQLVTVSHARLEYLPHAFPYGGPASLVALIESFDFEVTIVNDGSGPKPRNYFSLDVD